MGRPIPQIDPDPVALREVRFSQVRLGHVYAVESAIPKLRLDLGARQIERVVEQHVLRFPHDDAS